MSLEMWDQSGDPYNHVQLASNFAKTDAHDHTPGRGVLLTTESLALESITTALIAKEAVQLANLSAALQTQLEGSITTSGIANEAVTAAKLATNSVTTIKIASEAVTEAKLDSASKGKLAEATTAKSELTTLKGEVTTFKGIAFTTSSIGAVVPRAGFTIGTEYNPSSTRAAFVTLDVSIGGPISAIVYVAGKEVAQLYSPSSVSGTEGSGNAFRLSTGILVGPAEKWKVVASGSGNLEGLHASYRLF